jgi:hypothetical protein
MHFEVDVRRAARVPTRVNRFELREYLRERHALPQELLQDIAVLETLAAKAGLVDSDILRRSSKGARADPAGDCGSALFRLLHPRVWLSRKD